MKNSGPDLHMLNLVVDDMRASLDFYRQLGIAVPDGGDAAAPHVQLRMPGGFSLELDTAESARLWHAAWRTDPATVGVVIGFSLPTREAVDERYAELTSAGYVAVTPPRSGQSTAPAEISSSMIRPWPGPTSATTAGDRRCSATPSRRAG